MPATSQTTFINECHSFVSKQYIKKRDVPKHIPRPPNAFILYRSDFLKRRVIPPEVEKRQQNLSRIAGQCWNMLPETDKAIWFGKAAAVRAEHRVKYPSHETGLSPKDTNRLSARDEKKRNATSPGRSFGRFRSRRTRTPYCEGMFAALHDSKLSSPESKATHIFPIPASEFPLSTTPSLSPILLPHLLPPFTSPIHSSRQDLPSTTSESSLIRRDEPGYLLDSSGSEGPQWGLSRDSEITQSEASPSREPHPTLEQYGDDFSSCVPYPGLEQLSKPRSDPVAQVPLALPGSNVFSPSRYHLAGCRSSANDFNVTDGLAHFNQSSVPFYPWHSDN